jgi:uracil-DNA glycosylase
MTANRLSAPLEELSQGLDPGWQPVVDGWKASARGRALLDFIARRQREGALIYPADPFRALRLTPLRSTRVVILGQDPYHGPGQAEGLAFSVPQGVKPPPSLRNIFKELQRDLGLPPATGGHLGAWAQQGVLLLNTSLTVEDGLAGSHAAKGWEALTDALIEAAAGLPQPLVFVLWGAHAQGKRPLIEADAQQRTAPHLLLQSNHPSPLSATRGPLPFIGCGQFSQISGFLAAQGQLMKWSL